MSLLVLDVIEGPMSLFPGEETVDLGGVGGGSPVVSGGVGG